MSRVKTLSDLANEEQKPNTRPLSAAWTSGAAQSPAVALEDNPDLAVQTQVQIYVTMVIYTHLLSI